MCVCMCDKVKLVVIDSIAAPFRQGFRDMGMRNRILGGVAQNLIRLASMRTTAVSGPAVFWYYEDVSIGYFVRWCSLIR